MLVGAVSIFLFYAANSLGLVFNIFCLLIAGLPSHTLVARTPIDPQHFIAGMGNGGSDLILSGAAAVDLGERERMPIHVHGHACTIPMVLCLFRLCELSGRVHQWVWVAWGCHSGRHMRVSCVWVIRLKCPLSQAPVIGLTVHYANRTAVVLVLVTLAFLPVAAVVRARRLDGKYKHPAMPSVFGTPRKQQGPPQPAAAVRTGSVAAPPKTTRRTD